MIVGFVSDAHGNDIGLNRCLAALNRLSAEQVFFLGDCVGYLPDEMAVLEQLRHSGAHCIRGNHEQMLLGHLTFSSAQDEEYRLTDARQRVGHEWKAWMEQWPLQQELVIDGARLLLIHGSPLDPTTGYLYPDSDLAPIQDLPYDFIMCGHTHRPFIRSAGSVTCVNVGSCGLPRDVGNLASGAVYDSETRTVEIIRVEFDAGKVISSAGGSIHGAVAACLRRTSPTPPTGRLINV